VTGPAEDGFRMPAEWAPHTRCWMAWPCRDEAWHGTIDAARKAYADVARAIAEFEPVTMVCNPADVGDASLELGNRSTIDVLPIEIDDSWMRDSGPTFLLDSAGRVAAADWQFNAWGEKYRPYDRDAAVTARILSHLGIRRYAAPFVFEGGSVHVDGEGTALVTAQCLLNPNRNPGRTREQADAALRDWLGVSRTIWLPRGIDAATDGHVDVVACFARPGVVLALSTDDTGDSHYQILQENLRILHEARDAADRPLQVVEVPQPARQDYQGERLALSYINFYIANGGIVMPVFGVPEDDRAYKIIRDTFPDRRVAAVLSSDIFVGGGGIHCITQQQPAGAAAA
jgi:agmatine deiminase